MADLTLKLLGGYQGYLGGDRELTLATKKGWALLSYLALHLDQPVNREKLAALLWGERFEDQARGSLRQTLYEVRSALGDGLAAGIDATRNTVTLKSSVVAVDALRLAELATSEHSDHLVEAAALYQGPLLEGLETGEQLFAEWLEQERAHYQALACRSLEALAAQQLKIRDAEGAIASARRLLAIEQLSEPAHQLLMAALAAAGRRSEALKHYQELTELLQSELAVEPDSATQELRNKLAAEAGESSTVAHDDLPSGATADSASTQARYAAPGPRLHRLRVGAAALAAALVLGLGFLVWQPWAPEVAPAAIERFAYPLPEKPSVAVLPFDNLSGDPEQEQLSDGLTEEVITALSKSPNLFVIARNSSFTYKGKAVSVKQVAEDLGVRYILEGSVQRSGERVRINAQLIDALEGNHVWAERYDRALDDIFALQDDVTQNIMIALQVELTEGEELRLRHTRAPDPEAFEYLQRSRVHYHRFSREDNAIARELATKAAEISPDYPDAWSWLGWHHLADFRFGWSTDREASLRLAEELAEKAYKLDPKVVATNELLASLNFHRGHHDDAISYARTSVALAPSDANSIATLAWILCYAGQPEEAIPLLNQAMRLSPHYPAWYIATLGLAYMMTGDYPNAIAAHEELIKSKSLLQFGYSRLAALHAALGNDEKAKSYAGELLRIKPDFTIESWSKALLYREPEDLQWEVNALRKAGLPETPPLDLPDKPSIAVLPFENLSGDPAQDPIADGLSEDIITALSRNPDLLVIARNSSFTYKGKPVKVQQVAEDLGVRYVLDGSVQKSGERIRITAQLVDARNGQHVWADRYDRKLDDFFALQDEITRRVLIELQVKLTFGEHARVSSRETKSLEAWILRNQAYAEGSKYTKEGMLRARELYQAAVETDPAYSRAWAGVAWTYWHEARQGGWQLSRDEALREAIELAEHAIEIDPQGPVGYQQMANISLLKYEHDRAVALAEKAVDLAPADFQTNANLAWQLFWAGDAQRSVEIFARAKRLSPRYPAWIPGVEGVALHFLGRHDDAIVTLNDAIKRLPTNSMARARLIAVYVDSDRLEEAKSAATELLASDPEFSITSYLKTQPFKAPERKEWLRGLLLKAGLPE